MRAIENPAGPPEEGTGDSDFLPEIPRGEERWNVLNAFVVLGIPLATAFALPWGIATGRVGWTELIFCLAFVFAIGTSISAGYHRLFSHRSFEAAWPFRLATLLLGAAAFENSALKWSSDHRIHHRWVDTDRDPYDVRRGFWWSHMGWILFSPDPPIRGVRDLECDPLVRWQHRHVFVVGIAVAVGIPLAFGLAAGNVVGFLIAGVLLRIVLNHHTTFLINSAAHVWGSRPFNDRFTARDNGWLALLTYGEGYHNFHHTWAYDYRNGRRWYQWDTTKWLLGSLRPLGLVGRFRRVPESAVERARIRMEEKEIRRRLAAAPVVPADLDLRLATARERLDAALAAAAHIRESWEAKVEELRAAGLARRQRESLLRSELEPARRRRLEELRQADRDWRRTRSEVDLHLSTA
jgi:stearoyl-CoA desaturase (delta-9 desaturase)